MGQPFSPSAADAGVWGGRAFGDGSAVLPESGLVHVTPGVSVVLCTSDLYVSCVHRDTDTLVGLPRPIHESVKTLKQVSRLGCQSSERGTHQYKLDDPQ